MRERRLFDIMQESVYCDVTGQLYDICTEQLSFIQTPSSYHGRIRLAHAFRCNVCRDNYVVGQSHDTFYNETILYIK